jgi:hypothetical protein
MVDFETIAGDLYGLVPGDFTAARSLRVREARKAGDRELADALSELRRPTVGAWLANQLRRQRNDDLEELLRLGEAMRNAQDVEDGAELRRLSQQRRRMVTALLSEATALAKAQNQPVSENSRRELETTLEAGVADPDTAETLRSGRLAVGQDYSGFGPVGSSGPAATSQRTTLRPKTEPAGRQKRAPGQAPSPGSRTRSPKSGSTVRSRSRDEASEHETALAEAQVTVTDAENQLRAAQEQLGEVQAERDRLHEKVEEVQRLLRETRGARQEAEQRLTKAHRAELTAQKEVARTTRERDKAQALLERTRSSDG